MSTQINSKIVSVSVSEKKEHKEVIYKQHVLLERDEVISGKTYKVKTPLSEHALYITINNVMIDGKERPFEIFINSKAMDSFQWIVALTRVISAVFRHGGNIEFLVEELKSVFDPKGGYFKKGGRYMPSIVAEIGDVIEAHLIDIGMVKEDKSLAIAAKEMIKNKTNNSSDGIIKGALCDKCKAMAVVVLDGCKTCLECGASSCG